MLLSDFHNLHKGETCIIAGVGPNLKLTPPELFDYPSFGVNTIYKYLGWQPTYFVGVDNRLMVEDGEMIADVYRNVIKFVPAPDFNSLEGDNFYRFKHRTTGEIAQGGKLANHKDALTQNGIYYRRVMDAVFQIAWHMGFTTMLTIGIQHKPHDEQDADRQHFWGLDAQAVPNQPFDFWFDGYRECVRMMNDVQVLNISADTYVPVDVLPRDDWMNWMSKPMKYFNDMKAVECI